MSNFSSNSYWSADYVSGIDSLKSQAFKSVKQLHEIRKLIFNYISYYHSNSEFLNTSAKNLYSDDITFKQTNENSKRASKIGVETKIQGVESISGLYLRYIQQLSQESELLLNLASSIDKNILKDLTSFIKFHEPKIIASFSELDEYCNDYVNLYSNIEKVRLEYMDSLRLKEFAGMPSNKQYQEDIMVTDDQDDESTSENEDENKIGDIASDMNFPLKLGSLKVQNFNELQSLLKQMIEIVPCVKRKILIPGYKNETFASESFCEALCKLGIDNLISSKMSLEKFGQSFLDFKLVNSTGIFQRKFKSENMWLEWSDLAEYIAKFNGPDDAHHDTNGFGAQGSILNQRLKSQSSHPRATTDSTDGVFKFHDMLKSVKDSFLKTNYDDISANLEIRYNKDALELEELKYKLERAFSNQAIYMTNFENKKIEVIYYCLNYLSKLISSSFLNQSSYTTQLSTEIEKVVSNKNNYTKESLDTVNNFSTGVFFPNKDFPRLISGSNLTSSLGLFQSLKFQFNLYSDIPLQVQNYQTFNCNVLSLASIPYFLYKIIQLIDLKDLNLKKYWLRPINQQSVWRMKEKIHEVVTKPNFEDDVSVDKVRIQKNIIDEILHQIKSFNNEEFVNFLKNWLLETSDSIISFIVFDPILTDFEKPSEDFLFKHLSTIPRSNLSSLLYLLEHICMVFDLGTLQTYGTSLESSVTEDHLSDQNSKSSSLKVSKDLSSMEHIGAVPFLHLIMRPSIQKNSTGFKPPLQSYTVILDRLLSIQFRTKLHKLLLDQETKYRRKKDSEKHLGLQVKKLPIPTYQISHVNGDTLQKPEPTTPPHRDLQNEEESKSLQSSKLLNADNFALRPFKTKTTPMSSPKFTPKDPTVNSNDTTNNSNRSRSSSSNFLKSEFNVEFEH